MEVKQVYEILNTVNKEVMGETAITAEDLSGVITIGNEIFNANKVDNYVRKLINHIGKVIFVNRTYKGFSPNILMDGWEYGSILEKIDAEMPDAVENPSWELTDGESYDQDTFTAPKGVRATFFNDKTTFEVDISITERVVKESFSSLAQLNGFFSMIQTKIQNRLTMDYDNLKMRTINNMAMATLYEAYSSGTTFTTAGNTRAVNLLRRYWADGYDGGAEGTHSLTASNCLQNLDFLKYCSYYIGRYTDYITSMSILFNMGRRQRFTPKDKLHLVMLSDFKRAADVYLQSDTFNEQFTKLPEAETVPFWQGTGTDLSFTNLSALKGSINAPAYSAGEITVSKQSVDCGGIIAVMFDHDALGVCNKENRVPSHYNAKGEFFNYFYKSDAQYFNDYNENMVVFFVA